MLKYGTSRVEPALNHVTISKFDRIPSRTTDIETISAGAAQLSRASLDNPLYYLENLQTVIRWILEHHSDFLLAEERQKLSSLLELPVDSQALFARLTMRKGDIFRLDALSYTEIADIDAALQPLAAEGWISLKPALDAHAVFRLCRRSELLQLLSDRGIECPSNTKKQHMLDALVDLAQGEEPQPLEAWWPQTPISAIGLQHSDLLLRVQLMFFGNLYQDWSAFVLAELGHQQYEDVPFSPDSRGFQSRQEVDQYLAIHRCMSQLYDGVAIADIVEFTPAALDNPWLEYRRQKLLFQLAREAERQGDTSLALKLYTDNPIDDAQIRRCRILEKTSDQPERVLDDLEQTINSLKRPESVLLLSRIQQRLRRKTGIKPPPKKKTPIPTIQLTLPQGAQSVERQALQALIGDKPLTGVHCENGLFTSLFGLLFWPVLFEALPGAFFHPFQAGPADLFRPDFVERRSHQIQDRLALLDSDAYQQTIRETWQRKHGRACTLVHWGLLDESLLENALRCIPAKHLAIVFKHLLSDLRHHRRGMPDLALFDQQQSHYQLIEVKGPGDRLQDHQRLWIETMLREGLPVSVAEVRWEADA